MHFSRISQLLFKRNISVKLLYNVALITLLMSSAIFLVSAFYGKHTYSIFVLFFISVEYAVLLASSKMQIDTTIDQYLHKFLNFSMLLDPNCLPHYELQRTINVLSASVSANRSKMFIKNGCVIPLSCIFFEIVLYIVATNVTILYALIIFSMISCSTFMLVKYIVSIKNNTLQPIIETFSTTIMNCSRGLKLYDSYTFAMDRITDAVTGAKTIIKNTYIRTLLVGLVTYTLLFAIICLVICIGDSFFVKISENLCILIVSSMMATILFAGVVHISGSPSLYNFERALLDKTIISDSDRCEADDRSIDNIFISFNNVSLETDSSIIDELSFAIEPGDFVIATGEQINYVNYVYDLIFKHCIPCSGSIYIGGINSEGLPSTIISNSIGMFDEDFCLIFGTVFDNIAISTTHYDSVIIAASRAGLDDHEMYLNVYNSHCRVAISQTVKLKIQIARVFLHKYKALMINHPKYFKDKENEALFYNFIKSVMKSKTIMMATTNLDFILYSSKVLYLGKETNLFGAHLDIINNMHYHKFITDSGYNLSMSCDDQSRSH